jgi:hypothetical protein
MTLKGDGGDSRHGRIGDEVLGRAGQKRSWRRMLGRNQRNGCERRQSEASGNSEPWRRGKAR